MGGGWAGSPESIRSQVICSFPSTLGFCTQRFQRSSRSWLLRATRCVGVGVGACVCVCLCVWV